MNDLYYKKREYEKLLNDLNNLYEKLEECSSNLVLCKKKIESCIIVDDVMYLDSFFCDVMKKVDMYKKYINDYHISEVKNVYNNMLSQLNKM